MADIVTVYGDSVYQNLRPLHANWEPTQPIALGDYGILTDHTLERLGNVSQLGLQIGDVLHDDVGDQKIFASGRNTTLSLHGAASGPGGQIKAGIDVSFAEEGSVFFNAAGCSYSLIGNKSALGQAIMQAYEAGKWDRGWAVVTDLIAAKSTTIGISTGANAKLALEASGSVPQVNLADASIGLQLSTSTNVGYQVIAKSGLTPLIGVSAVQTRFLGWSPAFKPLTASLLGNAAALDRMLLSRNVETEAKTDLYFGQVF
jgi:hypothetical protein